MGYAGDLTPEEAHRLLDERPDSVLVDCRTRAEWAYVGAPDLSKIGKQVVFVEWNRFEGGQNPTFVEDLRAAGIEPDQPVAFLCRSGVRSRSAASAATAAGFESAYNISGGFEGPPDDDGHRGRVSGWKVAGLPWRQP